ncbi:MAG TPA: hypothetical protein DIT07_12435 [Sphingobacteriaceae bacterium]|nr:hypothetical protein [Sphingobacteriaceae bacterium]
MSKVKIFNSSILKRKLPFNYDANNSLFNFFNEQLEEDVPEIWQHTFSEVFIDSNSVVYNKHGAIIFEIFDFCLDVKYKKLQKAEVLNFAALKHPKRFLQILKKKILRFLKPISIVNTDPGKRYLLITDDRVNNNFYHWINEALLRLVALGGLPENSILLLPEECWKYEYVRNSLKVFEINEKQIYLISAKERIYVQHLEFITCSMHAPGACNYLLMLRLRDKIIDFYKDQLTLDFGDKIYISRERSKHRKVMNEVEVLELIEPIGFKKICAEDYTLIELISIMLRTRYCIAMVSAGLTHMMFMKEGGFVLELIHEDFICPTDRIWPGGYTEKYAGVHYFSMANALGINYLYQPSKRLHNSEYIPADDILVDIAQLKKNIDLMH